jgi:hypothetical protein
MSKALDELELECLRRVAREVERVLAYFGDGHGLLPLILIDLSMHMNTWSIIESHQTGDPNPPQLSNDTTIKRYQITITEQCHRLLCTEDEGKEKSRLLKKWFNIDSRVEPRSHYPEQCWCGDDHSP